MFKFTMLLLEEDDFLLLGHITDDQSFGGINHLVPARLTLFRGLKKYFVE